MRDIQSLFKFAICGGYTLINESLVNFDEFRRNIVSLKSTTGPQKTYVFIIAIHKPEIIEERGLISYVQRIKGFLVNDINNLQT